MTTDRDRLVEALRARLRRAGPLLADDLADALLPEVQALVAEGQAEALRSMADWTIRTGYAEAAVLREFHDRAAALDPS